MAKDDPYFQFPICLIALPVTPWEDRMATIISYSILEFGVANEILTRVSGQPYAGGREKTEKAMEALRARLKFSGGSFDAMTERWAVAEKHLAGYRSAFPGSVGLVRLRNDLCFDAKDADGIDERQFRILAAIYSAIGNCAVKQVSVQQIIHRSAGCVSRAVFDSWAGKALPFTRKQVRASVDELEARGLFKTCVFNRRQKYFTHSLAEAELRAQVVALKSKARKSQLAERRQRDHEMTQAILAARHGRAMAVAGPN